MTAAAARAGAAGRPMRLQLSRTRDWRAGHPTAVNVARPSRWGNPFRVAVYGPELSVALYRQALGGGWSPSLLDQTRPDSYWDHTYALTQAFRTRVGDPIPEQLARAELRGLDLGCWCGPDERCHADLLLIAANPGVFRELEEAYP